MDIYSHSYCILFLCVFCRYLKVQLFECCLFHCVCSLSFELLTALFIIHGLLNKAVARIFARGVWPSLPFPSLPLSLLPPFPSLPFPLPSLSLPLLALFLSSLYPTPQIQLGSVGERCKLPQRGSGRSPGRKRVFDAFTALKTHLVATSFSHHHHHHHTLYYYKRTDKPQPPLQ